MKGFITEFKQGNKKKSIFSFNLMLLFVVMFFICDRSLFVSEFKNLFNFVQVENIEVFLSFLMIPTRAISGLSQIISIFCVLELIFAISFLAFSFYIIVKEVSSVLIVEKCKTLIVSCEAVKCKKFVYKENLRFIC